MTKTSRTIHLAPDLELPIDAITQTFAILGKRGRGKSLALTTPIATERGWTTMADIRVGDRVFDESGSLCNVTAVHAVQADRPCYQVTFNDGASIVADGEHLWATELLVDRLAEYFGRPRPLGVRTTEEIRNTLRHGKRGDLNHSIPVAGALQTKSHGELPIDPYVLGCWLGDGASATAVITTVDEQLLSEIRAAGYRVGTGYFATDHTPMYRIHENADGTKLNTQLRELGLLDNKHIPGIYLRASIEQRWALLEGLMDTDGWTQEDRRVAIASSYPALASGIYELIVSLGFRVFRRTRPTYRRDSEVMAFCPNRAPFRLERKLTSFVLPERRKHGRRMITAVEPIESVPVRCIAVDSPSRLYLAGEAMIPTHNTNTAVVLAEELIGTGLPVWVVDTVGAWWGLRSSADGKKAGLPVVVFGGDHGDVPLEETAGALIARVLVDKRIPAVIDTSLFSKAAARRFLTAFVTEVYHRNRQPVHVIFDEADELAPQRPGQDGIKLLGAMEDFVRRGRLRGLGCTLVTQRPAVLHKDVLTQAEVLVAMGMTGPRDVNAINEWVQLHADEETARQVRGTLAALPVGTAWVWSPEWLNILQKVAIRQRRTFDSSATPKVGQQVIVPQKQAEIDLEALGAEIAATAEKRKADDPTTLRRHIADLERQITRQAKPAPAPEPETVEVEVPVLDAKALAHLDKLAAQFDKALPNIQDLANQVQAIITAAREKTAGSTATKPVQVAVPAATKPFTMPATRIGAGNPPKTETPIDSGDFALGKAHRAILTVLAQRGAQTAQQVATLAGYSANGGGYNNAISALRTAGYLTGRKEALTITDDGQLALGEFEPLPEGQDLVNYWLGKFGKAERLILGVLIEAWPESLDREALAAATDYAATGGGFNNSVSKLKTLALIHGDRYGFTADDELGRAAGQ